MNNVRRFISEFRIHFGYDERRFKLCKDSIRVFLILLFHEQINGIYDRPKNGSVIASKVTRESIPWEVELYYIKRGWETRMKALDEINTGRRITMEGVYIKQCVFFDITIVIWILCGCFQTYPPI